VKKTCDKKDGSELFKEILQFKKEKNIRGFSILETILLFCEEKERDVEEVGELLKKDKSFKITFQEDLKFNHEARFSEKASVLNISEWI